MIPRSVPVMANFWIVLLGLSGPVTHPTSAVPGGCGRRGCRCCRRLGRPPERGGLLGGGAPGLARDHRRLLLHRRGRGGVRAFRMAGSRPSLGSGAASLAPTGMCPIGRLNGANLDGLGIRKAWLAAAGLCGRTRAGVGGRRWRPRPRR